jgi:hypothetical protein
MGDNDMIIRRSDPDYFKKYKINNKERYSLAEKKYRETHHQKITCNICDANFFATSLYHHNNSQKHKYALLQKENVELLTKINNLPTIT